VSSKIQILYAAIDCLLGKWMEAFDTGERSSRSLEQVLVNATAFVE